VRHGPALSAKEHMRRQRKKSTTQAALPVMRPDAAGIDVGATEIYAAVPVERDRERPVRCFPTFTEDLHALADWLEHCCIKTVAMESTSVYWIPLFQILEARGLEICLVNARHVKNVPGRKTDVSDCQWLQYLHAVGLLRASFRPEQTVCAVRSLLRHRESLVQMTGTHIHHMQKALDQMNLQLHHVISDITGVTGLAIIEAVLKGERDPRVLAKLRNHRIKASEDTIAKSLVGDYRSEHLFTLRQSLTAYRSYQKLIEDCDEEIHRSLEEMDSKGDPPSAPPIVEETEKEAAGKSPFQLSEQLKRILGVDLTKVPSLGTLNVQILLGEIGPDLTKFRSASAFASWLGLCPANDISGGTVLRTGTRKVNSRAAKVLRLAAQTLYRSKTPLGDFYRRMRAKLGGPKAVTATAHKLARIIYHLVTTGHAYDATTFAKQQLRFQKHLEAKLRGKARELGFQLVPMDATFAQQI
jgi:transposase